MWINGESQRYIESAIQSKPGTTTPELAELLGCSVGAARWVVHSMDALEFYDGNHIRLRQQDDR